MNYAATILPDFDREIANTRKVLERVPEDKTGLASPSQVPHDRLER